MRSLKPTSAAAAVQCSPMDPTVITHLDQVTPAWLTRVLTGSGALTRGAVVGFDAVAAGTPRTRRASLNDFQMIPG